MEPKDVPYLLLGAMSTLREEMKKTVEDLVEKGRGGSVKSARGPAQADGAVREPANRGRKEREDLLNAVGKEIASALDNMGAVTKTDVRALDKKLAAIEKKVKQGGRSR